MKKYILDASFILTSFASKAPEVRSRLKSILLDVKENKAQIYAPELIHFELGNGIRFSYQDSVDRQLVFESCIQLPMQLFHFENHHLQQILEQCAQTQTTYYDSSYHYLAILLNGVFLTCDQVYFKKAKNLGYIELVK